MSTSERRQRKKAFATRWLPEEFAELSRRAEAAGLSRAAYIRRQTIDDEGPRAQRRTSETRRDLARLLAAVNKIGGNINQIARALNRGRDLEREFAETLVRSMQQLQSEIRNEFDRAR